MLGKKRVEEKVLEVDASMQGTLSFRDPVNLRINGHFEGTLDIKGKLTIGERSIVKANIVGEEILIAGQVTGDVVAKTGLKIIPPGQLLGNVKTPVLSVQEGAVLNGNCSMPYGAGQKKVASKKATLTVEEIAQYLELEASLVKEWAESGKIPARKEADTWRFDRAEVEEWLTSEKMK